MVISKKYENAILYICSQLGGSLRGKKKLAKLLYYLDFDRYEFNESMRSVTGDTYVAWKMGPVPEHFKEALSDVVKKGSIEITQEKESDSLLPTEIYTAKTDPDMSVFDDDDKAMLSRIVKKYGG
ncbi:MAG: SocA family protein, partial [Candidatus Nomurabacteria bacterium]|nr:SocA family protein [Candidatus Nomurabacteria bacterium]